MLKKIQKIVLDIFYRYNAWLTTDKVVYEVMKEKNKKGKNCNLVQDWKNVKKI